MDDVHGKVAVEMVPSSRKIAKNASVLLLSQMITWGLSFLLTVLVPRYLGPEGVGQLQLANALWAILAVIAAMGTDMLITKEIARSPQRLNELLGTTLVMRGLIFAIGSLGMVAYVLLAGYRPQTVTVILIIGVAFLIAQLAGTFEASIKGLERMEYTALAAILSIAVLCVVRIGLLVFGYGVIPIATVVILANFASLAIMVVALRKIHAFRLTVDWRQVRLLLGMSLPYFMVTIGIVLYHQIDTVIISLLVDEKTIGWYGVADHLYGTLLFIPNVFVTALFPVLSRAYTDSLSASQKLAQKSINLLVLISMPIGLGIVVISQQLVVLLFGAEFVKSGVVMAARGILLALTYTNMLMGFLLISMDRQKIWATVILIATIATIPLDLILIPWTVRLFANGALGASLSFAITELGMTVMGFALLPRGTFSRENLKVIGKIMFAAVVMAGITWIFRNTFILIPIFVGAVTYAGCILALRALPKEDWAFLWSFTQSFQQRLRGRFSRTAAVKGS